MTDLKKLYDQQVEIGGVVISKLKSRLTILSLVRLLSFVMVLVSPYLLLPDHVEWAVVAPVAFIALFLISLKIYQQTLLQKQFEQHKVEINKLEIESLDHQFQNFDNGSEFINPEHFNSYDLDIFGRGSLFQFLNRTTTLNGKTCLANLLIDPMLDPDDIKSRQQLVKELAVEYNWRQNFSAQGKMYVEAISESTVFSQWGHEVFTLRSQKIAKYLLLVLPAISLLSIGFWIVTGNSGLFILLGLLQFAYWMVEKNNTKLIYSQFGKRVGLLQKYGQLLLMIENFKWATAEGKALHAQLIEGGTPSAEIRKLEKIITAFDNRNNLFAGIILNLVFLWDIMCSYRIIMWHNRNSENFKKWGDTIAFIDAVNSLANFTFNHPDYAFPDCSLAEFGIEAKGMGHPLIHPKNRVDNDFSFTSPADIVIVTGANMAGKSTFLRTVGVNMLLAMSGAPVCAVQMRFKPVEVFSNMRTTDSLFDDESYFFAELKRIKVILDELDKGRELLIILDEILKGTNSVDKLAGSQKLIRRLIGQGAHAIIATHDLKLTELENEYPDQVRNQCFEISIENNEMQFDYQLRSGVTTIMNATFLMKKMGIIDS